MNSLLPQRRHLSTATLCLLITAGGAANIAPAQTMEEVVVTANHREQPAAEIPLSLQVLAFDEIAASAALNGAEDITEYLNGVQTAVANGTQVVFQIRGIGAVDHQALTPGSAAVYSDGVFLATNVQTSALLYDLDRVEVLKGPQGTLYGRNASSGAINFMSARPGPDQQNYLYASAAEDGRFDLRAAIGGAAGEATHYRIAARSLQQDAALDNVVSSELFPTAPSESAGELDEFGLRAAIGAEFKNSTLLLRAHYEEDNGINTSPRNSSLALKDFELSVAGDGQQTTDNEFFGLAAEWEGSWNAWQLTSITAVEGYNQQYGFDFDGSPAPFDDPTLNANLSYDRDYLQFSQEFRAQNTYEWGRALVGLALSYDDFEQTYTIWCGKQDPDTLLGTCPYVGAPGRTGSNPASDTAASTLITDIDQTRETAAVFSRNTVELNSQWELTLGARLTYERIEGEGNGRHIFEDGVVAFNNRGDVGPAIGSNSINDLRFSGDLALQYATNAGMAYASLAQSFKSGGFNGEVANNALHYSDEGLFDTETVTALELGFKSVDVGGFNWTAALFYQYYDAPQARIFVDFELPDGSNIVSNSLSNLDTAYSYGLESTVQWQATEQLRFNGGITLLDTEIDQSSDLAGNAALFDGNSLPFASDVSATLSADYAWQVATGYAGNLRMSAKYRSDFYLDAEGLEEREQSGYTTVSAEATLRTPLNGLELSVFARNLLDEDYAVSGFGFIGYNTFRSNPRTLGVGATYEF